MCGGGSPEIKETPEQKELARIAMERWRSYEEMYLPAEKMYFDYVDNMDSAGRQQFARGAASAGVESAFGEAVQADAARLATQGQGVDPSSGRFQTALQDRSVEKAAVRADVASRADQALQDAKIAGKQNIVAMGNNQAGQAVAGLTDVAQAAGQEARGEAIADLNSDLSNQAAAGMAVGAGYGAYQNLEDRAV
ncbi:MAG: hypothetical protein CME59_22675 [Halioglobus sp.]|nr:hypothetical protein [Halioglobus sp.]|tara:strand:- start:42 stop:623 length:582 start_codon:yes stop_codon:yes gene_type:complete